MLTVFLIFAIIAAIVLVLCIVVALNNLEKNVATLVERMT